MNIIRHDNNLVIEIAIEDVSDARVLAYEIASGPRGYGNDKVAGQLDEIAKILHEIASDLER